jgi:hypothetical protein
MRFQIQSTCCSSRSSSVIVYIHVVDGRTCPAAFCASNGLAPACCRQVMFRHLRHAYRILDGKPSMPPPQVGTRVVEDRDRPGAFRPDLNVQRCTRFQPFLERSPAVSRPGHGFSELVLTTWSLVGLHFRGDSAVVPATCNSRVRHRGYSPSISVQFGCVARPEGGPSAVH